MTPTLLNRLVCFYSWAARYNTWLLVKLMPKGVCLFFYMYSLFYAWQQISFQTGQLLLIMHCSL